MGVLQFPTPIPVTNGDLPALKFAVFTDSLSTVTTAGYMNQSAIQANVPLSNADVLLALYGYSTQTGSGSFGIFTVNIANSNGQITLTAWDNPGNVVLPVVSGDFAVFNGTSGQIKDAGYLPSNAAKTNVVMLNAAPTIGHVVSFTDVAGTVQDAGFLASNVMLLNAANAMSAAGSITLNKVNGTEATNAVTASGVAGVITTSSLSTAGGASYAITWTNTKITATSVVFLTISGGTNTTQNITFECVPGAGSATLTIYNNTAATALNGTIFISYLVM